MAYRALDYSLQIGSRVPPTGAINLAYISIPKTIPDELVLVASANRFSLSNIDGTSGFVLGTGKTTLTAHVTGANLGSPGNTQTYNQAVDAQTDISPSGFVLDIVSRELRVNGVYEDASLGWHPIVRDGLFVKRYQIPSNENSGSWFLRYGWTTGDTIYLMYSVPEVGMLQPYITSGDQYGKHLLRIRGERVSFLDDHTMELRNQDIYGVERISIRSIESGSAESLYLDSMVLASGSSSEVVNIDPTYGRVVLSRSFSPDDLVEVDYLYYEPDYVYRGYWSDGVWYPLDLNPQPGHVYADSTTGSQLLSTSGLPGSIIYLYALPSAVFGTTAAGLYMQSSQATGFYACLRHDIIARSYAAIGEELSTFGYAHFGDNHFTGYVPGGVQGGTQKWPCALVLGKFYVGTNATIDNLTVIDTRSRGGGIPENIRQDEIPSGGVTAMSTYYDISGWSGDPVMLDGTAVLEVPFAIVSGSHLTQEDLMERVRKYAAAGINVQLKYT